MKSEGRLDEQDLPDLIREVSAGKWTGTLRLERVNVTRNVVYNETDCGGACGSGGGITNEASLTVWDGTIRANDAVFDGGGIWSNRGIDMERTLVAETYSRPPR